MIESIKASPIASVSEVITVRDLDRVLSQPNGFRKFVEFLESRIEVGLMVSASETFFERNPLKNLGEFRKDEIGEQEFLVGERNEV